MDIRRGASRTVILTQRWAIKLPGCWIRYPRPISYWRALLNGLLCNMQEREFWETKWQGLCPIHWSIPGGFLVVMPRVRVMSDEEWHQFDYETFVTGNDDYARENLRGRRGDASGAPGAMDPTSMLIPAERKPTSFGWLNGRVVCFDYGRGGSK